MACPLLNQVSSFQSCKGEKPLAAAISHHILVIEKDNSLRYNLGQHLRQEGFQVSETDRPEKALGLLQATSVHLVLIGLEELKRDGLAIMREVHAQFPDLKIITINTGEQLELSIEAMRLGAFDDFLIPFDLEALIHRIRHAMEENEPFDPDPAAR